MIKKKNLIKRKSGNLLRYDKCLEDAHIQIWLLILDRKIPNKMSILGIYHKILQSRNFEKTLKKTRVGDYCQ